MTYFFIAKTSDNMVVHQSARLHVRVHDSAADECEAALFQIHTQCVRLLGCCRQFFECFPGVDDRFVMHKGPDVRVKTAECLLDCKEVFGVGDCSFDFETVADADRYTGGRLEQHLCAHCASRGEG